MVTEYSGSLSNNRAYRLSVGLRAQTAAPAVASAPALAPENGASAPQALALAPAAPANAGHPRRLALPTLESGAVRLLNRAADRLDGVPVRLGERAFTLRLRPPPAALRQTPLIGVRFGFAVGQEGEPDEVGWLGLSERLLRDPIERYAPLERLPDLPSELVCALLETVLEPLLGAGERCLGRSLRVHGLAPASESDSPPRQALQLALEDADPGPMADAEPLLHSVRLALPPSLLPVFGEAVERLPPRPTAGFPPASLPIKINFEGGVTQLTLAQLRSLEPGDLVMLDEYLWPARQALVISVEGQRRGVVALGDDGRRAVIEKFLELAMPEQQPSQPRNANPTPDQPGAEAVPGPDAPSAGGGAGPAEAGKTSGPNFDNLPLPMVFEVGSLTVPLSELKALRPGYVFELNKAPDKLVSLNVNGTRVGRGELVQIEDRVAVRVLEIDTGGIK